jgi:hypothetical protein
MRGTFGKSRPFNAKKIQEAGRVLANYERTTGKKRQARYGKQLKKLSKLGADAK